MSARPDVIVLKNVRLSFPKLFKKEQSTPESKPKYSCNFLIDPETADGKENIARINAALKDLREKTWGDKASKVWETIEAKRKPYRAGESFTNDEGDIYAGYEGMRVFVAANQNEFQRLDRQKRPLAEKQQADMYGGRYVDAVVSVYAITDKAKGGNGVFATLEVVRDRGYGDSFGNSGVDVDDYLDDLDDDAPEGSSSSSSSGDDDMI